MKLKENSVSETKSQTTETNRYTVIPNESKLCFTLFITLWILVSLFYSVVTYPLNVAQRVKSVISDEVLSDLVILTLSVAPTIFIESYCVLPLTIKMWRFWIFDTLIDVNALREYYGFDELTKSETDSVSNIHRVVVPIRDESNSSDSSCFIDILKFGIFRIPDFVLLNPEKYQRTPSKWKFIVLITMTIISVEFVLWMTLYRHLFQHFEATNITDTDLQIDIRIRNMMFLFCDFCISIPILYYVINPYIVNRLIPHWIYRKGSESPYAQWIESGISMFENIGCDELVQRHLEHLEQCDGDDIV